jgi:tetratricopeptide (TPR) repeat protein
MSEKANVSKFISRAALVLASVTLVTSAFAQEGGIRLGGSAKAGTSGASAQGSTKAAGTTSAAPASKSASPTETPRDPKGVTGISPFWEAIVKGDSAVLAQDFAGASSHYQTAITGSPKNPVGHLRMAELSLKQGELDRAFEFLTAALRFSEDMRHKAQAHFLLAEVKERKAAHDEALAAWRDYKVLDGQLPTQTKVAGKGPLPATVYVDTADKRTAAIEAKKKLDADYAEVRARIQKNVDAADEATGGKKADAATPAPK